MMSLRSPNFQLFLTSAEAACHERAGADGPVHAAVERIFTALQTPGTQAAETASACLPVCGHLPTALEHASGQPGLVGAVAGAFAGIELRLNWQTRPGAATHGEAFLNGHANATIAGPAGLEIRPDVWIGVSLMAPHTRYPDHHHPPEEIYLVLSPGEWRQANHPWHAPGIGGLVHNPPDIVHAMRSTEQPLLAVWFLWTAPALA